ncbi:hypothetical protein V2S66_10225 [Streptomyces sp. V4-01]|uniref:Uncharacterized protein n=1 Tax=Actinacidiphila polyblastidii TaxID=3110430 RepID=A0ABU7P951_9ACTN|nr:hypothetical protein [Streptomyces sp. V4-01]
MRRWAQAGARRRLFLLSHTDAPVPVPAAVLGGGHELLTGRRLARDEDLTLLAGGAGALRQG